MIEELKKLRKDLMFARENGDKILFGFAINNLDTLIYKEINTMKNNEEILAEVFGVTKRYEIQGTSFTTGGKKIFKFNQTEWSEFNRYGKYNTYPAWSFDNKTIVEY